MNWFLFFFLQFDVFVVKHWVDLMKSKLKMKQNVKYKLFPGRIHLQLKLIIKVILNLILSKENFLFNWIDSDELIHSENNGYDDSTSSLFQRRTEPILPFKQPSPLTALIQSTINKQNLFAQYAKFDGTVWKYFSMIMIENFLFSFSQIWVQINQKNSLFILNLKNKNFILSFLLMLLLKKLLVLFVINIQQKIANQS